MGLTSEGLDLAQYMEPEDFPRCTVCDMPVEHFYLDTAPGVIMFVARCHGECEVVEVSTETWNNILPETFSFGSAFKVAHNEEVTL